MSPSHGTTRFEAWSGKAGPQAVVASDVVVEVPTCSTSGKSQILGDSDASSGELETHGERSTKSKGRSRRNKGLEVVGLERAQSSRKDEPVSSEGGAGQQKATSSLSAEVALTAEIKGRTTIPDLYRLLVNQGHRFNIIHISVFACQLYRVGPPRTTNSRRSLSKPVFRLLERFKDVVQLQMLALNGKCIANILHACAKMKYRDMGFMGDLEHVSGSILHTFTPMSLGITIYSLAQLNYNPSRKWWFLFFRACDAKLVEFVPHTLAMTLWALARLQKLPDPQWASDFFGVSGDIMDQCAPQSLSMMIWALPTLGMRPDREWILRYLDASQRKLMKYTHQALANTIWALGKLKLKPPNAWLDTFFVASLGKLPSFSPNQLSGTIHGLGNLSCSVPESWMQQFCEVCVEQWDDFTARHLVNIVYGLGKLRHVPDISWRSEFLARSRPVLWNMTSQGLANLIWSVPRTGMKPGGQWMELFLEETFLRMPLFTSQELSLLLNGLALLKYRPDSTWLARYTEEARSKLPSFTPQHLSFSVSALVEFNYVPSQAWLSSYTAAVISKMPICRPYHLADILWALVCLKVDINQELVSKYISSTLHDLMSLSAHELVRFLCVVAAVVPHPRPLMLKVVVTELEMQLLAMDLVDLCELATALGKVKYPVGEQWMGKWVQAVRSQNQQEFTGKALTRMFRSLAVLGYRDDRKLLDFLVEKLRERVSMMSSVQLLDCLSALDDLQYEDKLALLVSLQDRLKH